MILPEKAMAAQYHTRILILMVIAAVVAFFSYVSNGLVEDLSRQERERMEIWADATRELVRQAHASADTAASQSEYLSFLLGIIERNTTIPVILADDDGNILQQRNFKLPHPAPDASMPAEMAEANQSFLRKRYDALSSSSKVIDIILPSGEVQHLYYEDSTLLRRLSYYPYVQMGVMFAFVIVVYFAFLSTKKAEQNRLWIGLSKETAHQLGTPISSLMAWMDLLPDLNVPSDTVEEMNKDVERLAKIASRFSKIGSEPVMEPSDMNKIVGNAAAYMSRRISQRIKFTVRLATRPLPVMASDQLFEWVLENLIKNAVDAMDGYGSIVVATTADKGYAIIDVADTGKGIVKKNFRRVFQAGFTTKKRGWGLGLALAGRIVREYHHGRIYVKQSSPGHGTTFRIEVPLMS